MFRDSSLRVGMVMCLPDQKVPTALIGRFGPSSRHNLKVNFGKVLLAGQQWRPRTGVSHIQFARAVFHLVASKIFAINKDTKKECLQKGSVQVDT